jgi:hypothetical protein
LFKNSSTAFLFSVVLVLVSPPPQQCEGLCYFVAI